MDGSASATTELSRVPKQARSREKFDAIIAKALQLIHEKGYEQVSVREIAREVGLPIASVYQYFPNKLSIVRQIWESYTTTLGNLLRAEISALPNPPGESDLNRTIGNIVDHMVEHHRKNPEFLDIWRCVDGSPELRALNREDTIAVAEMIRRVILQINPDADPDEILSRAIIVTETASANVKLAQELPVKTRKNLIKNLREVLISIVVDFM